MFRTYLHGSTLPTLTPDRNQRQRIPTISVTARVVSSSRRSSVASGALVGSTPARKASAWRAGADRTDGARPAEHLAGDRPSAGLVTLVPVQHGEQQLLRERAADVPGPAPGGRRLLPPLAGTDRVAVVVGVVAEVPLRLEQEDGVARGSRRGQADLVVGRRRVPVGQHVVGDPAETDRRPAATDLVGRRVAQADRLGDQGVGLARLPASGPHPVGAVRVADRQGVRPSQADPRHVPGQRHVRLVRRQLGVEGLEALRRLGPAEHVVGPVRDVGGGQGEQHPSLGVAGRRRGGIEQPQRLVVPGGQGEVERRLADGGQVGGRHGRG